MGRPPTERAATPFLFNQSATVGATLKGSGDRLSKGAARPILFGLPNSLGANKVYVWRGMGRPPT